MPDPAMLSNFNFAVQIELSGLGGDEGLALGSRKGAFSEVQGLEITLEPVSIREGGYNRGARQLVGKTTNPPLILKRGLSATVSEWLMAAEYIAIGDTTIRFLSVRLPMYIDSGVLRLVTLSNANVMEPSGLSLVQRIRGWLPIPQ